MKKTNGLNFYKEHPKTCDPKDFWGQVKRTVNGKQVSDEQIDMIVQAVIAKLELNSDDTLLDLCCGNGALSTYLFSKCRQGLGVDFSECLVQVAKDNFEHPPEAVFLLQDVVSFVRNETNPERFSKAVCYGSFQYLPFDAAQRLLLELHHRFSSIKTLFIGNLPDKDKMSAFFGEKNYPPGVERDPSSPIGIWRSREEFVDLAARTGWSVTFHTMPEDFYASHCRYDAILTPVNRAAR